MAEQKATPYSYAQAVLRHSRTTPDRTLFPGHNYQALAKFLNQPYLPQTTGAPYPQLRPNQPLVVLHRFSQDQEHQVLLYNPTTTGLEQLDLETQAGSNSGKIVFLNGFVPPEWLNLIGARYRVDPEFYRQHLSFMQQEGQPDLPGLPYTSKNIVRLPLISIGTWGTDRISQKGCLAGQRSAAFQKIKSYLRSFDATTLPGQGIARNLIVNDAVHFTVEQEASICVEKKDGGWSAICWLDGGLDLESPIFHSWLGNQSFPHHSPWILPTYMYQPKMALINPTQVDKSPPLSDSYRATEQAWRGFASLPRLYGQQLDRNCSHQDAFYALTQLFAISAFSVNQGLNLVEQCIDSQLKSSIEDMQISLENLHEAKSIVQNYICGLQRILEFIQTRGSAAKWPRATAPKQRASADAAAEELIHNYQHLLNSAISLAQRISSESQWLMHKAMLNESQRAFSQGSRVARLTFLAFLFIPLSFTSSLFGMNIVELVGEAGPKISVWHWAVLTAFVFAGSLLLWWWEAVLRFIKYISSKVNGRTAVIDKGS
ncbi:hypothetical protein PMG11_05348 [Penicillium brasilianum]|uniref:CorA family metal ion transporter n=1 Tax=Penicillium brasilianum TaxID=104259 RepID=A0A0F7VJ92_PENBI|nr:hypothetical protein PMG11_05348 [Penicillium brasilianum]